MDLGDIAFLYKYAKEELEKGALNSAIEIYKQMYILKPYDIDIRRETNQTCNLYYLFMNTYPSRRVIGIDWSSNGRYLLSAFSNPVLWIWDTCKGILVRRFNHGEYSSRVVSWSRVNEKMFAVATEWYLFVFDVLRELLIRKLDISKFAEDYKFSYVVWSPISPILAVASLSAETSFKLNIDVTNSLEILSDAENKSNVMLWDLNTNRMTNIYRGDGAIFSMSWSPDGQKLALGFGSGKLIIRDITDGDFNKYHFDMPIMDVAWSPKDERIALALWDGRLGIFNAKTEDVEYVFKSPEKILPTKGGFPPRIFSVSWNPEGRKLAFASESGKVRVLDVSSGRIFTLSEHSSTATVVSWSPDGRHIAAGFYDGLVVIYGADSKKELKRFESKGAARVFTDYDEESKTLAFAISGDYHYGELQFWDVSEILHEKMLSRYTFDEAFNYISFSRGGEYFAAVHYNGVVRLWHFSKGELELLNEFKFYDVSSKVAWRHDGKYVAFGVRDGRIVLFNVETGCMRWWYVSNEPIVEVAWSPNGKLIAAMDLMGFLMVARPYSKKWLINQPYANEDEFLDLKWDPSGKYITLINTGWDELLYIDLKGDVVKRIRLRCKIEGKLRFCKGISYGFSPSGRYAAVFLEDKCVRVIDTENFEVVKEWRYPYYIYQLKWLDEKRILACDLHGDWFIFVV